MTRMTPDERAAVREAWSKFVEAILQASQWSEAQLADRIGCSVSCISRWRDRNSRSGRVPGSVARKLLTEVAKELRLL